MAIGHRVAQAREAKAQNAADLDAPISDDLADQLIADIEAAHPDTDETPQPTMTMDQVIQLIQATTKASGFSSDDLKGILAEVVRSNATANAAAMQTALNRSNPNYVAKSPFHDAEGNEAIPIYTVYFGPQYTKGKGPPLPKDMYTPVERDLINRFQVGERKVARNGDWTAEVVRDGSTQELIVKVPMHTSDQRANLPSFALILRELLEGDVAVNPDKLAERVAELERKLAAAGVAAA